MTTPSPLEARYRLEEQLGKGGFGSVHRARHLELDRDVAIKFLDTRLLERESERKRFLREARVMANLSHPALLKVHEFGQDGDRLYLVLELARGRPLHQVISKSGPMPPRTAITLILHLLEVLEYLGAKGITHRDVKPPNLYATDDLTVQLGDFGIALDSETSQRLTATGALVGSLGYMAPELFDGQDASPHTDLFAAGVVFYEMLAGRRPWGPKAGIIPGVVKAAPLSAVVPGTPPALSDLLEAWLDRDPARRPATAHDARMALDAIDDPTEQDVPTGTPSRLAVTAAPRAAPTPTKVAPPPAPARRGANPAWPAAAVAIAVSAALVAVRPGPGPVPSPSPGPTMHEASAPAPRRVEPLVDAVEKTALGGFAPAEVDAAAEALIGGKYAAVLEISKRKLASLGQDELVLARVERELGDADSWPAAQRPTATWLAMRIRVLRFNAWTRALRFRAYAAATKGASQGSGLLDLGGNLESLSGVRYDGTGLPLLRNALELVLPALRLASAEPRPGLLIRSILREVSSMARNEGAEKWEPAAAREAAITASRWLRVLGEEGDPRAGRAARVAAAIWRIGASREPREVRAALADETIDQLKSLRAQLPPEDRPYLDRIFEIVTAARRAAARARDSKE